MNAKAQPFGAEGIEYDSIAQLTPPISAGGNIGVQDTVEALSPCGSLLLFA